MSGLQRRPSVRISPTQTSRSRSRSRSRTTKAPKRPSSSRSSRSSSTAIPRIQPFNNTYVFNEELKTLYKTDKSQWRETIAYTLRTNTNKFKTSDFGKRRNSSSKNNLLISKQEFTSQLQDNFDNELVELIWNELEKTAKNKVKLTTIHKFIHRLDSPSKTTTSKNGAEWLDTTLKNSTFASLDIDGDGKVTLEDFYIAFESDNVDKELLNLVFKQINKSKDGNITAMEFAKWQSNFPRKFVIPSNDKIDKMVRFKHSRNNYSSCSNYSNYSDYNSTAALYHSRARTPSTHRRTSAVSVASVSSVQSVDTVDTATATIVDIDSSDVESCMSDTDYNNNDNLISKRNLYNNLSYIYDGKDNREDSQTLGGLGGLGGLDGLDGFDAIVDKSVNDHIELIESSDIGTIHIESTLANDSTDVNNAFVNSVLNSIDSAKIKDGCHNSSGTVFVRSYSSSTVCAFDSAESAVATTPDHTKNTENNQNGEESGLNEIEQLKDENKMLKCRINDIRNNAISTQLRKRQLQQLRSRARENMDDFFDSSDERKCPQQTVSCVFFGIKLW